MRLLVPLLFAVAVFPQARREAVGLSSERLERISGAVQQAIEQKRIAGAVTLVAREGQTVWLKAQGMAGREAGKPMRTDNIFRSSSTCPSRSRHGSRRRTRTTPAKV